MHILLAVFAAFEYFCFIWLWTGDGEFTLIGCGISFIIFLAIHILLLFKTQNRMLKRIIVYSAIILTPILSIITVYAVLAPLCGVIIEVA